MGARVVGGGGIVDGGSLATLLGGWVGVGTGCDTFGVTAVAVASVARATPAWTIRRDQRVSNW